MNILGVNVGQSAAETPAREGGACLLVDGVIRGAISEERLTRRKHCGGYAEAARMLLGGAGLEVADLDLVVVSCYGDEPKLEHFGDLGFGRAKRVEMVPSHHLSHAYSAFFPSRMEEALILVADNEGCILGPRRHADLWKNAMERLTLYAGRGASIELLERDMDEEDVVSLGEIYGNITRFIGLGNYLNAGKTMALAAYGDAERFEDVPLIECLPKGVVRCPMRNEYLAASGEIRRFFREYGHDLPPQRDPESVPLSPLWADLAAAVQSQLEQALLHKVRHWVDETKIRKLCLAGGVALNCVANRRLWEEIPLEQIYVQPNAGDQGQGLGNVLYGWHSLLGRSEPVGIPGGGVYLGGEYGSEAVAAALAESGPDLRCRLPKDVISSTARLLADGAVVGWFQGRSEWGPRALGNRSILANPCDPGMRDHLNTKVKHRESFRPFAPIVPWEVAKEFFHISAPCPSMTVAVRARDEAILRIPAAIHVDGTARVQTVTREENPRLHDLLSRFEEITGVPVLLNTSFNDRDEPIVENPADALRSFEATRLDALVLGDALVQRGGS